MAQWDQVKKLGPRAFKKLLTVFSDQDFPIQVRDLLADWLEQRVLDMKDLDPDNSQNNDLLQKFVSDLITQLLQKKSSSQLSTEECLQIARTIEQRYLNDPGALLKQLRSGMILERQLLERKEFKSNHSKLKVSFKESQIKDYEKVKEVISDQEIDAKLRELEQKTNKMELAQDLLIFLLSGLEKIQDEMNKKANDDQDEELSSEQVLYKIQELERKRQVTTMRQQWYTIEKKFMTTVNELCAVHQEILNGHENSQSTCNIDDNQKLESSIKTSVKEHKQVSTCTPHKNMEQIQFWRQLLINLASQNSQQMERANVLKHKVFYWLSQLQTQSATDLDVRLSKFSSIYQNLTHLISHLTHLTSSTVLNHQSNGPTTSSEC